MEIPQPTNKPNVQYLGAKNAGEFRVIVRRGDAVYDLSPRLDLRRHSPTGFAWGYAGSGPAQLALGILADYFGSTPVGDMLAQVLYMSFKQAVIAVIPMDGDWTYTGPDLAATLEQLWDRNRAHFTQRLGDRLQDYVWRTVSKQVEEGKITDAEWEQAEALLLDQLQDIANNLMHDHFFT